MTPSRVHVARVQIFAVRLRRKSAAKLAQSFIIAIEWRTQEGKNGSKERRVKVPGEKKKIQRKRKKEGITITLIYA